MKYTLIICCFFVLGLSSVGSAGRLQIRSARIKGFHEIVLDLSEKVTREQSTGWNLSGGLKISHFSAVDNEIHLFTVDSIPLDQHVFLQVPEQSPVFLIPDDILDSLYSDKSLGCILNGQEITFRVFAPRAQWVRLVLFKNYDRGADTEISMQRDRDGVWEYHSDTNIPWEYYGYRVWGPPGEGEMFDSTLVLADPYSTAVSTLNHYTHPGKSLIRPPQNYDWENDRGNTLPWDDLIIYEMHIRDLTAHPSSGLSPRLRGTYSGLIEPHQTGGLPYLKRLGVNAVELLPAQDFGNMEVPYRDSSAAVFNTWNPYAFNHWGYMTSYFFAPETYYSSSGEMVPGEYSTAVSINEFKNMVKAFHASGMAVLMDVVYNHVSQYDYNPLKYIDKFYYFRLNEDCRFASVSGCGNDLKTERPMARRLITDSVVHWMQEYHIDGFRFDLAKMIDWATIDSITAAARRINPAVILIAEPWGGGYDPAGFSDHGWASWNDQIRNGIKGQNPHNGLGFIFGHWQGENNSEFIKRYFMGSLRPLGGQYLSSSHSVNYLESHDDQTLGDFVRIALGKISETQKISDLQLHTRLDKDQMSIHKLAALTLFCSQGAVMIHEGQEFARSKVIAPTPAPDPDIGKIDHNSYNKNNETNWLNYDLALLNRELTEYYQGLIRLRKTHPVFRHSPPESFQFYPQVDSLFIAFQIQHMDGNYFVLLNGNREKEFSFTLPVRPWKILANAEKASEVPFHRHDGGEIVIPATTGLILMQ